MTNKLFTAVDAVTGQVLFSGSLQDPHSVADSTMRIVVGERHPSEGLIWLDEEGVVHVAPDQPDAAHEWCWATKAWVAVAPPSFSLEEVRAVRNRRLAACDWVVARALERGEPVPPAWVAYRQGLRDLLNRGVDLERLVWPVPPAP